MAANPPIHNKTDKAPTTRISQHPKNNKRLQTAKQHHLTQMNNRLTNQMVLSCQISKFTASAGPQTRPIWYAATSVRSGTTFGASESSLTRSPNTTASRTIAPTVRSASSLQAVRASSKSKPRALGISWRKKPIKLSQNKPKWPTLTRNNKTVVKWQTMD